jgi:dTMP kinase
MDPTLASMIAPNAGSGRFITLEGPDGSGKSTQAARLAESLRGLGAAVCLTREPGGTAIGEQVRKILLQVSAARRLPLADAFLFSAARAQHVEEVIGPALARGEDVVCDRFLDSTLAYQGYGSGLDLAMLRGMGRVATHDTRPDLTILLDLPVAVGLARRAGASTADITRFEADPAFDTAYHERVRQGYLAMAATEPARWHVVDAARDQDGLAAEILRLVCVATGRWDAGRDTTRQAGVNTRLQAASGGRPRPR